MTPQRMVEALSQCSPDQFDQILSRIGLLREHAPSPHLSNNIRALKLVHLARKHDPPGLTALEVAISDMLRPQRQASVEKAHTDSEPLGETRTILFLSANSMQTSQLAIETEFAFIQDELNDADVTNLLQLELRAAVTTDELTKHLRQTKPAVVHFSAHGSPNGEIVLSDSTRTGNVLVTSDALGELFQLLSTEVPECVVLNACYSEILAEKISRSVEFVIGMNREIGDEDALQFSLGFYRAMANGDDYRKCYEWGCNQIQLSGFPDFAVPRFKTQTETVTLTPLAPGDELKTTEERRLNENIDLVRPVRSFSWMESQLGELPINMKDEFQKGRIVPIWYGTNRKPFVSHDQQVRFSNEVDDSINYGQCHVIIPKYHRIGSPSDGIWLRFVNFVKQLVTTNSEVQEPFLFSNQAFDQDGFYESTQQVAKQLEDDQNHAFIFIHGYNMDFEQSAIQAAQISLDINIPGITAFFSWPSLGRLDTYMVDEERIVSSEMQLTEFLSEFVKHSGAKQFHIISHSMGNRGLLRALVALSLNNEIKLFKNIVLAAPDMNTHLFLHNAHAYRETSVRTTMYVSTKDRALALSHAIHDSNRTGFAPPFTVVDGVDTIDSTFVDLSYFGHGYFAAARPVLADMYYLIAHNLEPNNRFGIEPANCEELSYWQFKP